MFYLNLVSGGYPQTKQQHGQRRRHADEPPQDRQPPAAQPAPLRRRPGQNFGANFEAGPVASRGHREVHRRRPFSPVRLRHPQDVSRVQGELRAQKEH